MKTLILGAGGVGGYFGARLIEAGGDVTFLVRPRRAAQLARDGLTVESPHGNFVVPARTIGEARDAGWDLALLSCKAYDLDAALDAIAPAVGAGTHVLPLLNGLRHLEALDARFGAGRVLGGVAYVAATLTPEGVVRQLGLVPPDSLRFGARGGAHPDAARELAALFAKTPTAGVLVDDPLQAMWDKWVALGPLAAMTCLMRAPVGRIVAAAGGAEAMRACIGEVAAIARAEGHAPAPAFVETVTQRLTAAGSTFAASMLRDVERGGPTEAAHVVGDLVARAGRHRLAAPWLGAAWTHLQAYEAGRGG
jgi:2-dehydropantoate 2-reductase